VQPLDHNVERDFKDITSDKHTGFTGNRIPLIGDLHVRAIRDFDRAIDLFIDKSAARKMHGADFHSVL